MILSRPPARMPATHDRTGASPGITAARNKILLQIDKE